ncbi:hypothetical protein D3C78_1515170 [compost metagenome]
MQVTYGRYRIEADSYYDADGGWRVRCRITNTRTFQGSPIEPRDERYYPSQREANAEAIRFGRHLAANRLIAF